ncbi:MAG: cellulose synthase subunit BcsC-related outer membrane protein [bacterium]
MPIALVPARAASASPRKPGPVKSLLLVASIVTVLGAGVYVGITPAVAAEYGYPAPSDNPDFSLLMEQAYYWLQQGRDDQARNAWRKALRLDPNNKEAKMGLAALESAPQVNQAAMDAARKRVAEKDFANAIVEYQSAFGGKTPPLPLASEYYETLAATPDGRPQALAAISELLTRFPHYSRLQMTQAKLRTYDEKTRRTGIAQLEALSKIPALHDEALAAWKQALIWLKGKQTDSPSYSAYLEQVPTDYEVTQQMRQLARDKEGDIGHAWQHLESGRRKQAEKAFKQILKAEPDNSDALAGLGLLRLEQQRFSSARRLLEKAIAADPAKAKDLESALKTSRYWSLVRQAERQRKNGQLDRARRSILTANRLFPGRADSLQLQANIEADLGHTEKAIKLYQRFLKQRPASKSAQQALVSLLLQAGKETQAMALVDKYHLPEEKFRQERNRIEARQLRSEASNLSEKGDKESAIQRLLRARILDPENVWIRHDLALIYVQQGRIDDAYAEIDTLLEQQPLNAEALYARALISQAAGSPYIGLMTLERIPVTQRSQEHEKLQHALWRNYQLSRIRELMLGGDRESATALAQQIRKQAGEKPEARMVYAAALAEAGQKEKAIDQARLALALSPAPSPDQRLQYAAILLRADDTERLKTELAALAEQRAELTTKQSQALDELEMALAIREANTLRKDGDLASAYEKLRPWLDKHPDDPGLMLTMAALYGGAGDNERSEKLYQQVAEQSPDNVDAWTGAAGSALSSGDYSSALAYVEQGLKQRPESSDLVALRGIIERLRGNQNAAASDFRTALEQYESRQAGRDTGTYPLDVVSGVGLRLVGEEARAETLYPYSPWEQKRKHQAGEPLWVEKAREELAQLEDQINTSIYAGVLYRSHSGDAGRSELSHVETPLGFISRRNSNSAWGGELRPTSLRAGDFEFNSAANLLLGSAALDLDFLASPPDFQDDSGLGLSVWYQHKDWTLDLGSTPLGFQEQNLVGGINWQYQRSSLGLNIGLNRRAVKESLLSWAGALDPRTNIGWGGVTRNEASFSITQDQGKYGFYGDLKLAALQGEQVANNNATETTFGVYWKVIQEGDRQLSIGGRLHYMGFDKNLRYFTLGHGGYFSPQSYLALTFPVNFSVRKGALRYSLAADAGLYQYDEDGAALYPDHPAEQATLASLTGSLPASIGTGYAARDDSGLSYQISAEVEYNLTPSLSLAATLNSNNANDFRENSAWGYVRYYFKPRATLKQSLSSTASTPYRLPGETP